ncbi:efflux RND transporter periplasmic adaptor subunit [Gilvimarinus sp. SDUM040013]|uniref:Efflux RND transporter periplasmic adaptor subunit n=1 Tax=Gilvimarinus gilvus TaxID=3058038 RepID=A0ABU4RX49_9GAMM|nr:efflux RND transporter periplasmic adaptor subunit [Gilvimarinus sp. SDUM040013]MDO3386638.1 efflux RND transporter periplasmic adaptor subunit [Gilvimarinus sp. SDUM040013]MDX6849475.1 efflux RND transporter periplasmic adaptor subunit [Gilvimarinus sp. SDUM040013]
MTTVAFNKIKDTSSQDVTIKSPRRAWHIQAAIAGVVILIAALTYAIAGFSKVLVADEIISGQDLRFAVVERGDLVREVAAQARVVVANSPTLFSTAQGKVELLVKAGDDVQKGQILARVSSPELGERLAREGSELTRLKIALEQQKVTARQISVERQQLLALAQVALAAADREQRRSEQSFGLNLISAFDYEEVQDNLARAKLEFRQAEQNLGLSKDTQAFVGQSLQLQVQSQQLIIDALQRQLDELTITSPVDGMVGNVEVNQSQMVAANQPLISVVDLSSFEVEARVAEGLAAEIGVGMDAAVSVSGEIFAAVVTAISPEVVQGEVTVRIGFSGSRPPGLRQNQRLSAKILLENITDVLMVQRGPFFDNYAGSVFKVNGEDAIKTPVQLGAKSLRAVQVTSGLQEGDKIIVSALSNLGDIKKILVTN